MAKELLVEDEEMGPKTDEEMHKELVGLAMLRDEERGRREEEKGRGSEERARDGLEEAEETTLHGSGEKAGRRPEETVGDWDEERIDSET